MPGSHIKAAFAKGIDGRIAHVSEVPRGLKCECLCLHCDGRMIARKGEIKVHHFAHHGPDCGGAMTWLHRTVQEILVQERSISLPSNRYGSEGGKRDFSEVRKEALVGNRRVDCLGVTVDGNELATEIRVTHGVDEAKLRDFRDANIAAVEVDLREFSSMLPDWATLRNAVCESSEHIKWLHDPLAYKKELSAMAGYRTHLRDLLQRSDIGTYSDQYAVGGAQCWKCGAAIPVFAWSGDRDESNFGQTPEESKAPPVPRPRTIAWSQSRTLGGAYWGNRRAKCTVLQGSYLLFDNMLDYLEGWYEEHGDGVSFGDLGDYYTGSLYLSDL